MSERNLNWCMHDIDVWLCDACSVTLSQDRINARPNWTPSNELIATMAAQIFMMERGARMAVESAREICRLILEGEK